MIILKLSFIRNSRICTIFIFLFEFNSALKADDTLLILSLRTIKGNTKLRFLAKAYHRYFLRCLLCSYQRTLFPPSFLERIWIICSSVNLNYHLIFLKIDDFLYLKGKIKSFTKKSKSETKVNKFVKFRSCAVSRSNKIILDNVFIF